MKIILKKNECGDEGYTLDEFLKLFDKKKMTKWEFQKLVIMKLKIGTTKSIKKKIRNIEEKIDILKYFDKM